jgi:hypothetical protein
MAVASFMAVEKLNPGTAALLLPTMPASDGPFLVDAGLRRVTCRATGGKHTLAGLGIAAAKGSRRTHEDLDQHETRLRRERLHWHLIVGAASKWPKSLGP